MTNFYSYSFVMFSNEMIPLLSPSKIQRTEKRIRDQNEAKMNNLCQDLSRGRKNKNETIQYFSDFRHNKRNGCQRNFGENAIIYTQLNAKSPSVKLYFSRRYKNASIAKQMI